jgi:2-methylisocitrate lyase-like PEP mutase family enzyme
MSERAEIETVRAKAAALAAFHQGPRMLVLPNAWDAASAKAFEAAGFPAIATTSGGVAAALGYRDHEEAPAEEMLAAARRIIGAVSVPVTVDLEAGYQIPPEQVAERLISIGAAGLNFEDSDHHGGETLVDAERQAEKLSAIKEAANRAGVPLVLNARVDVFLHRAGSPEEQLAEGLRRARLYRQAGADCIYPILLSDEAMIAELVSAVGVVNVNVRREGPLSLARAAALDVRRVSYATSIFREVMAEAGKDRQEDRGGSGGGLITSSLNHLPLRGEGNFLDNRRQRTELKLRPYINRGCRTELKLRPYR